MRYHPIALKPSLERKFMVRDNTKFTEKLGGKNLRFYLFNFFSDS